MKKIFAVVFSIFITLSAIAQGETSTGGSIMRSNHKIWVAVAVLTIILTTVFIFLFTIERRLKKLEDKQN